MSKLTYFLDNQLRDGGEVVIFTHWPHFTHQKDFLVTISVRFEVNFQVIVQLEGLGKLKNFNDLIRKKICDLPACSTVPQPTILPQINNAIFWDVTPCGFCKNQHFGGTYQLHH
jgi:hypothetical protein